MVNMMGPDFHHATDQTVRSRHDIHYLLGWSPPSARWRWPGVCEMRYVYVTGGMGGYAEYAFGNRQLYGELYLTASRC